MINVRKLGKKQKLNDEKSSGDIQFDEELEYSVDPSLKLSRIITVKKTTEKPEKTGFRSGCNFIVTKILSSYWLTHLVSVFTSVIYFPFRFPDFISGF